MQKRNEFFRRLLLIPAGRATSRTRRKYLLIKLELYRCCWWLFRGECVVLLFAKLSDKREHHVHQHSHQPIFLASCVLIRYALQGIRHEVRRIPLEHQIFAPNLQQHQNPTPPVLSTVLKPINLLPQLLNHHVLLFRQ